MFEAHPNFKTPEGPKKWETALAWFKAWGELEGEQQLAQIALSYVVAEGNLGMVKVCCDHGASLKLGYSWGITLVDFAAGKGHIRILKHLLEQEPPVVADINRQSLRERISAIDRASKAGHTDCIRLLHKHGADTNCRRLNRQTPAHGAAMCGHLNSLETLAELEADLDLQDAGGKSPLDWAAYFHQTACVKFLEKTTGKTASLEGFRSQKQKEGSGVF